MSQSPVASESTDRFCRKPKKKRPYQRTAFALMQLPIINDTTNGCQETSKLGSQTGEEYNKETFLLHRQDKGVVMNDITKFLADCYSSLDPHYKSIVTVTYMKKAKNNR